jgi:hypothetical protein
MATIKKPFGDTSNMKKASPTFGKFQCLDFDEVKALEYRNTVYFIGKNGGMHTCRVNGKVKLWKTRHNDLDIPMKYGLYESFTVEWRNGEPSMNLFALVETL